MTVLNIGLRVPSPTGRKLAGGRLAWQPTQRRVDGTVVILPVRTSVELVGETVTADIDPGVYWFQEDTNGGESAYRIVPDVGPVEYATLAAVDPATLDPEAVPPAAWYAYTDTLSTLAGTSATAAGEARDAAVLSQDSAQASASAAALSETNAEAAAEVAVDASTLAGTWATSADLSATSAAQSELAASGFATNAGNSATAAGNSAAAAESSRGSMVTTGTVDVNGHLILGRVDANPHDAGYVVGPPITMTITETTTGPDTPGTPGPQGLTGPTGAPGGIVLGTTLGTNDLNSITASGVYRQDVGSNATLARNYPRDLTSGVLVVLERVAAVSVIQTFYPVIGVAASEGRLSYTRTLQSAVWSPWRVIASQRVDQTAGRAIYTWDDQNTREQLVYGDTGWRDITPETGAASGWVRIRRQGYRVTLWVHGWTPTAAGGSTRIYTAPVGFQTGNNSLLGLIGQRDNTPVNMGVGNTGFIDINNTSSASAYYAMVSWETIQPWPSVLPGTANGSIPNL